MLLPELTVNEMLARCQPCFLHVCASPPGNQYWLFREANLEPGYPQPLTSYGLGIPYDKVDAVIWWEPTGHTFFFRGDRWVYVAGGGQPNLQTAGEPPALSPCTLPLWEACTASRDPGNRISSSRHPAGLQSQWTDIDIFFLTKI